MCLWLVKLVCYLTFTAVAQEREVEGDLFLCDIGQGLGFRPGIFDGAIRYTLLFDEIHCNAISLAYQHCSGCVMLTKKSTMFRKDYSSSSPAYMLA